MAWRGNISKSLKELRILLCQSSPASAPARTFVEKNYKDLKSLNPKFPFLIRECSGIQPQMWARYAKPRGLGSSYGFIDRRPFPFPCRQISDLTEANGKRGVDTLAMVKSLEAQGVPSKQAEAITSAITKAFDDCLENVKENQSHLVLEEVRKLRDEISKLHRNISETRAGQRDEHAQEIHQLEQDLMKIPRDLRSDFNELKADFEATKYLGVKYAIFTLGTAGAAGLGAFCIMW